MTAFVIPTTRVSSRTTIDFWVEAFGLEILTIDPEDATDTVNYAELRLGDGRVMTGTGQEGGLKLAVGAASLYWVLDAEAEIDALHERAVAAGATSIFAPYDAPYGGRHCTLRDPDGHAWSFGTYRGVPS